MVVKKLKEETFKQAKLAKTKRRREGLARDRRIAEREGKARRNDLLPELAIHEYPISELQPPSRRTRKNSPEQIERICVSISEFGFIQPILVREGRVLDGWSRVLAAKRLGLDMVPVIECSHLSETQARVVALAVNRIGERGEWDLEELRIEFEELIELEVDLDTTGFSAQDQDIILLDPHDEDGEASGGDEVDPPPDHPVTCRGDIWQLGEHRVICADALEEAPYKLLLRGELAHAVMTDPPYNVKIKGNVSGLGKKVHGEFAMASGEMSDSAFQSFLYKVLTLAAVFLAARAVLFVFMDWRSIHRLYAAGDAAKLKLINLVVWNKQAGAMGALYRSAHELIAVFCKGNKPRVNNVELGTHGRDRTNVWEAPGANRQGSSANRMLEYHATPKPVELCVDALHDVTQQDEIVLDVFLGSGATLIAAEETGRRCRGIEIEPGFVDVCVRRWEKEAGKEARHAETGETFAEVAARRLAETVRQSPCTGDAAGEAA